MPLEGIQPEGAWGRGRSSVCLAGAMPQTDEASLSIAVRMRLRVSVSGKTGAALWVAARSRVMRDGRRPAIFSSATTRRRTSASSFSRTKLTLTSPGRRDLVIRGANLIPRFDRASLSAWICRSRLTRIWAQWHPVRTPIPAVSASSAAARLWGTFFNPKLMTPSLRARRGESGPATP
jgi:hypothetical protein